MFITQHVSHVTCKMSCIMCQVSHVRCEVLSVTFLTFHFFLQNGAASQMGLLSTGLPRLVHLFKSSWTHMDPSSDSPFYPTIRFKLFRASRRGLFWTTPYSLMRTSLDQLGHSHNNPDFWTIFDQ